MKDRKRWFVYFKGVKEEFFFGLYYQFFLLSARNQQEDILKGLIDEAHNYITKPFNVNDISSRTLSILQEE